MTRAHSGEKHVHAFVPAGFFAFRTALLPFDAWLDFSSALPELDADGTAHEASARAQHRAEIRRRLKIIVARPEIREALFVASPSTAQELSKWLANPDASDPRLEQTLIRYLERMSARSTPFGLFAGCSVGYVDGTIDGLEISLPAAAAYRRHSRLDNDHLFALTHHLGTQPAVRDALVYEPNSSLYHLAGRWRYVYAAFIGVGRRDSLVALESTEFLTKTIERARSGASVQALVDYIVSIDADGDITPADARDYVHELIDQQVLVSSLSPTVTGAEPLTDIITQLESSGAPALTEVGTVLATVRQRLADIDATPVGLDCERYREIEHLIADLGAAVDPSRLFQVDLVKPREQARCGQQVVQEISRAIEILCTIRSEWPDPMSTFIDQFTARYESREVPLVEVLDEESGIGFDRSVAPNAENAPLLRGLPEMNQSRDATWKPRDVYLLSRLESLWATGARVLELSEKDIARLSSPRKATLPDTFCADVTVGAANDGDFSVFVRHVSGPSGANIMGRFCHADPELYDRVIELIAVEQSFQPDAVFAEVVHLPDGRIGNVLARPPLRQFEIVYLGRSGVAEANRIPISDLLVSIVDGQVVLRSAKLQRRVLPRLTTMHNFSRGLGIYRFLCNLQRQSNLLWHWGALEYASFLPRVTHGRIVLSRARWRVHDDLAASITRGPLEPRVAALRAWGQAQALPRFVVLMDADNELLLDFENLLSIEAFLHVVKNRPDFKVAEVFPEPDGLVVRGPEGRFVHELILPFTATARDTPVKSRVDQAVHPQIQRTFAPGSEWLYAKFYAGTANVDALLSTVIGPLTSTETADRVVSRWFFVRYGDPEWHLRVRLHGDPDQLRSRTLARLTDMARDALQSSVWKVQIDTYEREIERYGGDVGIVLSEEIFWHDSEAVLAILESLPDEDARWRICARSLDLLLSDLGFPIEHKLELVKTMRQGLRDRFAQGEAVERLLGSRFRTERKALDELFDAAQESGHPYAAAIAELRKRSERVLPVVDALRRHELAGALSISVQGLAGSYLHMHANRLLRSAHVHQEFVLYDFLARIYESQLARARGRGRPQPTAV
jgi:thiopeptide-type bacteriocin biosynthesis protein